MDSIKESRAYKYACFAADPDPKIGRYVRKQCQKWRDIADGQTEGVYVDDKEYRRISAILKIIVHPDLQCSMYDGLEDYAILLITAVFCTKYENGRRYYTTGLLEIARKNFKAFTSAVIFIIGMLTLPKFSRLFSVAPDLKLSSELKIAINKIIESSPALLKHFKIMRSEVRCLAAETNYTPLAYSKDKLDGKLAHMFLADEVGAMDGYPVQAMRSSQITLRNKLGVLISTQYPNDSNGLLAEIDLAKRQLNKLYEGRGNYFALLYEPDEELRQNWQTDDNVLYQANPVTLNNKEFFDNLIEERTLAVLYEDRRENFLCKHCNIQYKGLGVEGYVDAVYVAACSVPESLDFWRGRRVWLGLDLSQTDDNTAVAMVTYDEEERLYAKVWGFLPKDKIQIKTVKEEVDYKRHIADKECFACGGEVIDYGFVERFILDIEKQYGVQVVQCGFDRYNAISTVQKLENAENPIECVELKQHSSVLHPATKLLKEKILSGEFFFDRNKLLEINFSNARCTEDTNLNKYVNKKRSSGKVDMVVALINAVCLAQIEMLREGERFLVQY